MKRDQSNIPWRFLGGFFGVTLLLYFVGFYGVEHLRERKGPWRVEFDAAATGGPTAIIHHRSLGIEGFRIVFEGASSGGLKSGVVVFDNPKLNARSMDTAPESSQELKQRSFVVPFGECIYQDLMFLPGVVTMNLLGHEIELMPRTLVIDKKEIPWSTPASEIAVPPPIKGTDATSN